MDKKIRRYTKMSSRKILFRGQVLDKLDVIYGSYLRINKKTYIVINNENYIDNCPAFVNDVCFNSLAIEVNPETIGQSTELSDKNGKKIFEGDIIRWTRKQGYHSYNKYDVSVVQYFNNGQYTGFGFDENKPLTKKKSGELEIIGNIYNGCKPKDNNKEGAK
jgi:uncharacterized phage protein (TIGR01671 family)